MTLAATSVPDSWYPTIDKITVTNVTDSTVDVTTSWTLAYGAVTDAQGIMLWDANDNLMFDDTGGVGLSPVATSQTINATGLPAKPARGSVWLRTPIGGLNIGAGRDF